jgi:hypothetical protein
VYGTDGKWLHRKGVLINHRDITNKENIWWSHHRSESYEAYHQDLLALSVLLGGNYLPIGAVSDWNGGGVAGIACNFGHIPHQRCLIHVLRSLKRLLPKKSPIIATQKLRQIALEIIYLENKVHVQLWQNKLIDWQSKYSELLTVKTIGEDTKRKWWYTHRNLRHAWRLLTKDQKPFFIYLTNHKIPKTNNSC